MDTPMPSAGLLYTSQFSDTTSDNHGPVRPPAAAVVVGDLQWVVVGREADEVAPAWATKARHARSNPGILVLTAHLGDVDGQVLLDLATDPGALARRLGSASAPQRSDRLVEHSSGYRTRNAWRLSGVGEPLLSVYLAEHEHEIPERLLEEARVEYERAKAMRDEAAAVREADYREARSLAASVSNALASLGVDHRVAIRSLQGQPIVSLRADALRALADHLPEHLRDLPALGDPETVTW